MTEVANKIGIARPTAKTHIQTIHKKLTTHNDDSDDRL